MRLANLLVDGSAVKVIDFDDCGFGWLLYDCATTVSFFEHKPEVPNLLGAWVRGYRKIRELPADEEAEIPTFIMLRRLVLLALDRLALRNRSGPIDGQPVYPGYVQTVPTLS